MESSVIGQYRVTGVLGKGGMGTVYSAEHMLLDRPVAVKVLLPKLSREDEMVKRFFNEARAATAIRHPGIVAVHDYGRTDDGSAYIVMEYLEGETLRERCKGSGLRWSTALALVRQVAGALGAAHAKGIVHRDLKPDNIFLVLDPEVPGGERIKLLDFGIARLTGSVSSDYKTQTGMLMGTPLYMSPEQCRGVAVDSRTDIYSLGCILFELCTGRPPFSGEGEGDLFVAHIREKPPTIASLTSGVPKEIDDLVQQMLAKAPADRVQTAEEIIRRIDAAKTAIGRAGRSGSYPALAPLIVSDGDGDGDGDGEPDSLASPHPPEPGSIGGAPTMAARSASRRSRRDAVVAQSITGEQRAAAPAEATAPTMAAAPAVTATPAKLPRAQLVTTLSGAIRTHEGIPEDEAAPPPGRRRRVLGLVAGGTATLGVLTLVLGAALQGGSTAQSQAAAASSITEPPPAMAPLSSAEPAAPSPAAAAAPVPEPPPTAVGAQPAAPSAQPAAPGAQPAAPAAQPAAPSAQPAAPSAQPAAPSAQPAAQTATATSAAEPSTPAPAKRAPPKEARTKPASPARGGNAMTPAEEQRWRATEAPITIQSEPAGASIYRGDTFFGRTPQTFTLERGDYEFKLELRLAGYQTQEIVVHPTGPVRKSVKLKRAPASRSQPSPQAPPQQQPAAPAAPAAAPPQQQPATPPAAPAAAPPPQQPATPAQSPS